MPITGLRCLFFIFKTAQKPDLILTHIFKTLKMLQVVNVFRTNHFRLMALKLFLYRLSHCDSIVFLHRDSSAFKKGSLSLPLIMRSCGYSCNRFLVNRTTIPPPLYSSLALGGSRQRGKKRLMCDISIIKWTS